MAYSEAKISETLALLAANEGNVAKTARQTGVTRKTIKKWQSENVPGGDAESVRNKVAQKKEGLADKFESIAHKVLDSVMKEDFFELGSFKDRITGAGIAVDKMRLLRGQGDDAKRGMDEFLEMTDFGDVEETEG